MFQTETIGKYEIIERIGEGGFGEVFRVLDPDLQVERAIKVPFTQSSDIDEALSEARKQARLNHEAVVQVHHVDKVDGKWVIIMDYAGGGNLKDKLKKEGPLALDKSVQFIDSLAGAVAEAHKNDLLHYDIKPENILFDNDGNVKLADFGLARKMEQAGAKMSRVIGTLEYMGPEQLNGTEDPRSEIWSLGAVFYEMLTGRICFEGENDAQIINKIDSGDFTPLRKLNPNIPIASENIVHKMLTRDTGRRYQNMKAVVDALDPYRKSTAVPRKKPYAAMVIAIIMVFLTSFGGGIYYAHRADIFYIPFLQRLGKIKPATVPEEVLRLDFEDQFERGLDEIEKGNHQLAYQILEYIESQAKNGNLVEKAAFFKASLALHYMKDSDLAFAEFKSFLKKYPQSRSPFAGLAHFFLGQIYFEIKHDYYRAIRHLAALIENFPRSTKLEPAKQLIQASAMQLVKGGSGVGLRMKSILNGFLPNNLISLVVSILGLISALSMPLAWIMTQYHKPEITHTHSVGLGFKAMMKNKAVRKLIIIVIFSQLLSFGLTQYQKSQDYQRSTRALHSVGVSVDNR